MNRGTRRANLKKLQLPDTGNVRKPRRASQTANGAKTISNFFGSQTNAARQEDVIVLDDESNEEVELQALVANSAKEAKDTPVPTTSNASKREPTKKRTKLTSFVYKNSKDIPEHVTVAEREQNYDDFETPEKKKIKKAPKLRAANAKTRAKRQPNIRSAFLRNEQIFSEITAQHCMADNFSPDEMQLALAISKSEAVEMEEDEVVVDLVSNGGKECVQKEESIRTKLQKYGFRTAAKEDYSTLAITFLQGVNRRSKNKWANKFTALTLRKPELQQKKLNDKIEKFLSRQLRTKPLNATESFLEQYRFCSAALQKCEEDGDEREIIRNAESLQTANLDAFFVRDLFEISRIPAGHLLKDWTAIQGRDLSPRNDAKNSRRYVEKERRVYAELEAHFSLRCKFSEAVNSNKKTEVKSIPGDNIECTTALKANETELDKLLELIEEDSKHSALGEKPVDSSIAQIPDKQPPDKEQNASLSDVKSPVTRPPQVIITLGGGAADALAECQSKSSLCQAQSDTNSRMDSAPYQHIRATSPDLFADSDAEMADVETNVLGITTYEVFSSDEVKISSAVEAANQQSVEDRIDISRASPPVIDLTQEDVEINPNDTGDCNCDEDLQSIPNLSNRTLYTTAHDEKKDTIFNEIPEIDDGVVNFSRYNPDAQAAPTTLNDNSAFQHLCEKYLKKKSKSLTQPRPWMSPEHDRSLAQPARRKTPEKVLKRCKSASFSAIAEGFSSPLKSSDVSVDLTQDDLRNDCLMLSDDEINYSLWKANQSRLSRSMSTSSNEKRDLTSSTDSEACGRESPDAHEFSILDFINEYNVSDTQLKKTASTNTLDADTEPIASQLLMSHVQCSPTRNFNDLSRERAEFGILDNHSEPLTQTPHKTPAKQSDDLEFSFLQSPSENAVFMKRYSSRNSEKYNKLLQTALNGPEPQAVDDELDEFDRLVYGSSLPSKSNSIVQPKEPTGLAQLLTGEISFRKGNTNACDACPQKCLVSQTKIGEEAAAESPEKLVVNERVFKVRIINTPKPDFARQSEAELLKQLYNFGIKPLKRKQAVKILEYIYNQTHPIIVQEKHLPEEPSKLGNDAGQAPQRLQATHTAATSIDSSQPSSALFSCAAESVTSVSTNPRAPKLNLQDCSGDILLRFSYELFVEVDDEQYIFQTNVSKKTPQPLLPFHIAWYNLVCSSVTLHETVVMYEPIDLQEIYLFLKSLGYRYEPKDMKTFFDRRCIIFRYDLTPPDRQTDRHTHKSKKKAGQKS